MRWASGCAVLGGELAHQGEIAGADLLEGRAVERRHEFRIEEHVAVRPAHGEDHVVEGLQFAGAVHQRMAGDDLLDQRGAGARHADDENRHRGGIAAAGFFADQFAREHRLDAVEQREGGSLVVSYRCALGGIAGKQVLERASNSP